MILHALRETNSNNIKKDILKQLATEEDKAMFQYAYDPSLTYYLKFKEIDWPSIKEFTITDNLLLNTLASRQITGNAARERVEAHCIEQGDLVKLICNKNLDCGVTATTLNKVFGKKFINIMEIQLAKTKPLENITLPITGQLKYNGIRVITIIKDGEVTFKTRKGHTFKFPELVKAIEPFTNFNVMYDGELCFGDSKNSNHTKVGGLVNSALKGTPIPSGLGLVYNMFDTMTLEQFDAQYCPLTYKERYENAKDTVKGFNSPLIKMAETWEFKTRDDIQAKYEELIEKGYEGLILKHWDGKYTFKRNATWIKMKAEKTADLFCADIQEGEGKYVGMIGALICIGCVEGKRVKVKVGTGLKDYQRNMNPDEYLEETIEVKYNDLIQDSKDSTWSLFLPVFIGPRCDK